jgi:general stress protein 26
MTDQKKDDGEPTAAAGAPNAGVAGKAAIAEGSAPAPAKNQKPGGPRITGRAENADELPTFLDEPNHCRVGTIDKNGFAHITPAWFHWDGAVFYVGADADDAKVANIRRTKTASIEIDGDVRRKRGILARGTASIVAGRAKYEEISIPQVRRYVPNRVPREMAAKMSEKGHPVVIEVRPAKIISWGR